MEALQSRAGQTAAVIGAGAVGSALARRLAARGYTVQAAISRTQNDAAALAEAVDAPTASSTVADLPADVGLVFCCVPDDALMALAERLRALPLDWTGRLVAHTSGARTAGVLTPLAEAGALTLSFHPVQTFTPGTPSEAFDGIYVGLEGRPEAVAIGRALAADLGAQPLALSTRDKERFHLAASMASNFFVTLMALVREVLASTDITPADRTALMRPLVGATWRNLQDNRPEEVLTGPIARGDSETVAAHRAALEDDFSHISLVYKTLAVETVRVARESGQIDQETAEAVLEAVHMRTEPCKSSPF